MKAEQQTRTNTERTFPEDNDTLYREMTSYMPNCYFPTSLGEDAIHEFAGGEFARIRDIICREYGFDEDRHIEEYAGVSPFDFVRDDIEQEIYRRIRKDYTQLGAVSIRKSLLEKIRHAVERENNIIGTFYRNRGVHYRDGEPAEYETSPIVVIHNPGYYGYGGYESATVYELFIDGTGKLLCTLNGEGGEDFDEPVENVQIEGLFEIAHWLEEYGFIAADVDDNKITVCEECGSDNIQTQAWVDPNTHAFIGTTGIDRDDNWCDECEEHLPFCTLKEFKERMQEWWQGLEFKEMEQVTGFRQTDFSPEDGYRKFVDACEKWWNGKSYDEKRIIWEKYHNEE